MLFKSAKYAFDIKSIIFFFDNYFQKDNDEWNKNLPEGDSQKEWEKDFLKINNDLIKLKDNHIYDYKKLEIIINFLLAYMKKKEIFYFHIRVMKFLI